MSSKKEEKDRKIWKCKECFQTFDVDELEKCPNCNSTKVGEVLPLNDTKLMDRVEWHPYGWQENALEAYLNNRDIRIAAGTRSGKSQLCGYWAAREFAKDGKHIWVIAPSYNLSEKVFNYAKEFIKAGFEDSQYRLSDRRPKEVESEWGSFIKSKSTQNENNLLAEGLDLAVIDEASRIKKRIWEKYIYQRLSSRRGKSVMISTPFGKNTVFYDEWLRCQQAEDGWSTQVESREGPMIDDKAWKRAKERLTGDAFRQEYMAEFLDEAATVFSWDKIEKLIDSDVYSAPKKGHSYVVGVDLGKRQDYTVITVLDKYTHSIVHFERFKEFDWRLQKKRIIKICRKYNRGRVLIDSTGKGDPMADDLTQKGFRVEDYTFSSKGKAQLIEKLEIYIDQEAIVLPDEEQLINELKSFGYRTTNKRTGEPLKRTKYEAPPGTHDDCVDSLALAVWQLRKPKRRNPEAVKRRKEQNKNKRFTDYK